MGILRLLDVIVLGLISQIADNSPIPSTVVPELYVVVDIWQNLYEKGKYDARVLN